MKLPEPYKLTLARRGFALVLIPTLLGSVFLMLLDLLRQDIDRLAEREKANSDIVMHLNTAIDDLFVYDGGVFTLLAGTPGATYEYVRNGKHVLTDELNQIKRMSEKDPDQR